MQVKKDPECQEFEQEKDPEGEKLPDSEGPKTPTSEGPRTPRTPKSGKGDDEESIGNSSSPEFQQYTVKTPAPSHVRDFMAEL